MGGMRYEDDAAWGGIRCGLVAHMGSSDWSTLRVYAGVQSSARGASTVYEYSILTLKINLWSGGPDLL
eukprot:481578-Prorocentrum_minimum.AAC.1